MFESQSQFDIKSHTTKPLWTSTSTLFHYSWEIHEIFPFLFISTLVDDAWVEWVSHGASIPRPQECQSFRSCPLLPCSVPRPTNFFPSLPSHLLFLFHLTPGKKRQGSLFVSSGVGGEHTQLSGILVYRYTYYTGILVCIVNWYIGMLVYSTYSGWMVEHTQLSGCRLECKPHIFTSFPSSSAMLWDIQRYFLEI